MEFSFGIRFEETKQTQARDWYEPSAVETRSVSPCLMNAGTLTISPVSMIASLV